MPSSDQNVVINIRKIREHKVYSQEYLATKLNISQNAYSKMELGYCKLTVNRLFKIAEILEVSPEDLVTRNHQDLVKNISPRSWLANL